MTTVIELIDSHIWSSAFARLAPDTQKSQRLLLRRIAQELGALDVDRVTHQDVQRLIGSMASKPGLANNILDRMRTLMRAAVREGLCASDPTQGVRRYVLGSHHTWTETEIETFSAKWRAGDFSLKCYAPSFGRIAHSVPAHTIRLAFDLLLETGQRRSDVIKIKWADLIGRHHLFVRQQKTGTELCIPVSAALWRTLELTPRSNATVLTNEHGNPWTAADFSGLMAFAIRDAGLPRHCVPHGLRKALGRRLAEKKGTAHEIQAVLGLKTLREVTRYTAAVDQRLLADSAFVKLNAKEG